MKNVGLDDWGVVALGTHDFAAARRVAVHAEELLDRPRVCATIGEAVADCAWVVGTSSRRGRASAAARRRSSSAKSAAASTTTRSIAATTCRSCPPTLRRARLSRREARLWLAALRRLGRALEE
jgi:tRNA C32,U32 (ribose-2'-O)-methylase TrmJ